MNLREVKNVIGVGLLLSGLQMSALAAQPVQSDWIVITSTSDGTSTYSVKKGSYELTTTKSGSPIALVLGQIENKKDKSVSYGKWYVSAQDCDSGLGKLVVLKINGSFDFEADYVAKGKNVASGIADMICAVYHADVSERQGKGI